MDLKLELADGGEEFIPANSVFTLQAIPEGKIAQYPDARSRIYFKLGDTVYNRLISNDIDNTVDELTNFQLARLTAADTDDALLVSPQYVVAVLRGQEEGTTEIVSMIGAMSVVVHAVEKPEAVHKALDALRIKEFPLPAAAAPAPVTPTTKPKGNRRGNRKQ